MSKKDEFNFDEAKKVGDRNKNVKVTVTSRLDPDVVHWLKEEAENKGIPYQTFMNSILKESMTGSLLSLEAIRRVIKEELKNQEAG